MPACAQVVYLHVPAGDAGKSIPELSRQSGVQIIGPGNALHGVITPEVEGSFDVVAALELMLRETGLKVSRSAEGVITISLAKSENTCNDEGETMNRKSRLATTTSWLAMLFAGVNCAAAQSSGGGMDGAALETVVVSGIRSSLNKAEQIKRSESNIVDAIVPEDIGKLPDVTVGDALQRITGVQVTRNNNQVTGINIRGLPNVITTLNGNEVFTTTGRTFAFQNLPAEVLSGLSVYKTVSADQVEGGISGLVDVRTHRPFDFDGLQVAGSATAAYGTVVQKWTPNLSFLVSDRWKTSAGEFGALFNLSWKKDPYNYVTSWSGTPRNPLTAAQTGLAVPIILPNVGTSTNEGTREYPEANIALQFRPNNDMEVHFDLLWTGWRSRFASAVFNPSTTAANLPVSNVGLHPNGCVTLLTSTYGCTVDSVTVGNAKTTPYTYTSNQAHDSMSDDFIGSLGMKYTHGPWLMEAEFSGISSAYHDEREIIDMNVRNSILTISNMNYRGHPVWNVSVDPTAPANYYLQGLNESFDVSRGSQYAWSGHVTYQFSDFPITSVDAGARYALRKATSLSTGGVVLTNAPGGNGNTSALGTFGEDFFEYMPGYAGYPAFVMPSTNFLLDDTDQIRAWYHAAPSLTANPASTFRDDESATSFWLKANYEFSLFSFPVDGQFGVRTVTVGRTLTGTQADKIPAVTNTTGASLVLGGVTYAPGATITAAYTKLTPYTTVTHGTDVLPSISARVHLSDDLQVHASFGKTMTLPGFGSLNPSTNITPPAVNRQGSGSAGNPYLAPTRATAYDVSLEYYFPGGGSATIAGFYRDVKGYVIPVTETRPYDPAYCVANGIPQGDNTAMCNVNISTSTSSGAGYIEGYEVAVQKFADFLPGFWSGFGAQLNYTWIQSTAPIQGNQYFAATVGDLTNVSPNNYSAVLLFEKYGFSARLAATYRSKFIEGYYPGNNTTPPINVVKPTTYLDFGTTYNVTPQITVTGAITNILGEAYHSYAGTEMFPRDTRIVNKTYKVGLHYRLN
jgi:TonB-dependent receptor